MANRILSDAVSRKDFRAPVQLLKVLSTAYHQVGGVPEFLCARVYDSEIWKNIQFWEFFYFWDIQKRRNKLAKKFRWSVNDWDSMNEQERKEAVDQEDGTLFDSACTTAFNMLLVGMADAQTRIFISRMASFSGLANESVTILMSLAKNISKAQLASGQQLQTAKASHVITEGRGRVASFLARRGPSTKELYEQLIEHNRSVASLPAFPTKGQTSLPSANVNKHEGYSVTIMEAGVGSVECIAVSPSGALLVVGGSKGSITTWGIDSVPPRFIGITKGHTERVTALRFSSDSLLVTASEDTTVKTWDVSTNSLQQAFVGHDGPVICLDVGEDNLVVSGSQDSTVRLWDTRSPSSVATLSFHKGAVRSVEATHLCGAPVILSSSEDGTAMLWDLRERKPLRSFLRHNDWVTKATLKGTIVVTSSCDCTLKIWESMSGECLKTLKGHTGHITCFDYDQERNVIVSGSADKTVRIWDPNSGVMKGIITHPGEISSVGFSKEGQLVVGTMDYALRCWKNPLTHAECAHILKGHTDWVQIEFYLETLSSRFC